MLTPNGGQHEHDPRGAAIDERDTARRRGRGRAPCRPSGRYGTSAPSVGRHRAAAPRLAVDAARRDSAPRSAAAASLLPPPSPACERDPLVELAPRRRAARRGRPLAAPERVGRAPHEVRAVDGHSRVVAVQRETGRAPARTSACRAARATETSSAARDTRRRGRPSTRRSRLILADARTRTSGAHWRSRSGPDCRRSSSVMATASFGTSSVNARLPRGRCRVPPDGRPAAGRSPTAPVALGRPDVESGPAARRCVLGETRPSTAPTSSRPAATVPLDAPQPDARLRGIAEVRADPVDARSCRRCRRCARRAGQPPIQRRQVRRCDVETPAIASRIAAGSASRSTRSSRGSSSVASSPVAGQEKDRAAEWRDGFEPDAVGRREPACSVPRTRWPAARPVRPISAVSVVTASQWSRAVANGARSVSGVRCACRQLTSSPARTPSRGQQNDDRHCSARRTTSVLRAPRSWLR